MLSPKEMRSLEDRAFAAGANAEALMEEAGRSMAAAVRQFCPKPGTCIAFFGKGHNGGDALVTARLLSEEGWRVVLIPSHPQREWTPLTTRKHTQAGLCETWRLAEIVAWLPEPGSPCVVLDGLLGIGARGPLAEPIATACQQVNRLRQQSAAQIFALDIPTGLDGGTGTADANAVVADVTLTVGFAKTGLLADGAEIHVGRLAVLPLADLSRAAGEYDVLECATPASLAPLWKRRSAGIHKGDCGRVVVVAGAIGTLGAAVLAAKGALRAGAGLVTLCVSETIYPLLAPLAPAECMVRPVAALSDVLQLKSDALAIGPGLGLQNPFSIVKIIREHRGPAVVDADALNILADGNLHALTHCAGPRLLTPHPGEMARLDPESPARARRTQVQQFTDQWPVTLLLKGARTVVGTKGRGMSFNTTGNPGMASGGMGDVLTGVCAALIAQGLACHEAAIMGAWLCGRAAESLVVSRQRSQESLLAGDVAGALGDAFHALRENGF